MTFCLRVKKVIFLKNIILIFLFTYCYILFFEHEDTKARRQKVFYNNFVSL